MEFGFCESVPNAMIGCNEFLNVVKESRCIVHNEVMMDKEM